MHGAGAAPLSGTWLFQRCQQSWHSAVHMMICQHLKRAMLYQLPNMFPHQSIIYLSPRSSRARPSLLRLSHSYAVYSVGAHTH